MVLPERERVCLRPGGTLHARALDELERESRGLLERGFTRLAIDLRGVRAADWTAAATLAAISRLTRRNAARLTVIPGSSPAVQQLIRAGLMDGVPMDTVPGRPYFDWSR